VRPAPESSALPQLRPYCPCASVPTQQEFELLMNSWPESLPMKESNRMSPRKPRIHGKRNGETRFRRNMLMGSALSVNASVPPALGPHQRLCLPNDICQFAMFIPTYASSRRNWLVVATGMDGAFAGK